MMDGQIDGQTDHYRVPAELCPKNFSMETLKKPNASLDC